jgi:hypothetical protein
MHQAEQAMNRLQAGDLLRLLDALEPSARRWEEAGPGMLRRAIASRYRKLVGIEPGQRQEFRAALERVREQGGMPVAELVDLFRAQSSRLFSSSDSSGASA